MKYGIAHVLLLMATAVAATNCVAEAPVSRAVVGKSHNIADETAATAPADARPIGEFKPSRDGFAFTNAFIGMSTSATFLDRPGQYYGLCGGMSVAATDYFLSGQELPRSAVVPEKGSALWMYLFGRQVETLANGYAGKFIEWTRLPETGKDTPATRTIEQLAKLKKEIDAKQPAVIGLIMTDHVLDVFSNHQILAFAYEAKGTTVIIHTYDPNYPRDDHRVLTIDSTTDTVDDEKVPTLKIIRGAAGKKGAPIRGFFVMPYAPADPAKRQAEQQRDLKSSSDPGSSH